MARRPDEPAPRPTGPETPREPPPPGRPPTPSREVLRDERPAIRDATRGKPRRHATAAQRQARDRAGNRKVLQPAPSRDRAQPRRVQFMPDGRGGVRCAPRPQREDPLKAARDRARELQPKRQPPPRALPSARDSSPEPRQVYSLRDRHYSLTESQARVLHDVGRFRVVETGSLARHLYAGDREGLQRDLKDLRRQGLALVQGRLEHGGPELYATLSRQGRALTAQHLRSRPEQAVHSGISRPREARHDAAIYDAFQHARQQLERDSCRVLRVRLEHELTHAVRREAYAEAAEAAPRPFAELSDAERATRLREATAAVAARHALPAEADSVDYPDLQIEYERPDGSLGRANLEVVTEHYTEAELAAKTAAGFSLYLPANSPGARGAPPNVHSLAEDIFEL